MTRTHCAHCDTLLTPGAPFCLSCFLPLEEEEPAAPVEAPAPAAAPFAVAAAGPAPSGPAPAPPAPPGGDFFAPATPFPSHPGQGGDWRAAAPAAALLAPPPRRQASRTPLLVLCVLGVLALLGGVAGARALLRAPSEKAELAKAFREGRPPGFLPSFPDIGAFDGADPEGPGDAKAFVQAVDARVRAGNDAIVRLQGTLGRWADGDATDADVRAGIADLDAALDELAAGDLAHEAPGSTRRGLARLHDATIGYRLALGALDEWMDSKEGGARLTFRLTVGSANVDWDTGVIALYRAGELPAPALPHPQPKR